MSLITLLSNDEHPVVEPGLTTFLNPHSYLLASDNEALFSQFDKIYCDGIFLVYFMRAIGRKISRISFDMTSMAPVVFDQAVREGLSVCLVGGEEGIAQEAAEKFRREYPGLNITHIFSGFFVSNQHRDEVIDKIATDSPDIVIVGMGAILQEQFLVDLCSRNWRGFGYTCGGFFHQTANKGIKYYPDLINRLHLRWLYRIFDEPYLFKRYLNSYPKFVCRFIKDLRGI